MQNMQQLMKQAQELQKNMQQAQKEIEEIQVVGESGAGAVKITLNGKHTVLKTQIQPSIIQDALKAHHVNLEDPKTLQDLIEILEDLVTAAINAGIKKTEEISKQKLGALTAGLNLPKGFGGSPEG